MDEIRERLESELSRTIDRIRHLGGAIAVEELQGGIADRIPVAGDGDVIRNNEDREMSFAARSLLVERANRLAEALERLRVGEYGRCEQCEESIAPARLRAMPEVTTCVRCQDQRERARRFEKEIAVERDDADDD